MTDWGRRLTTLGYPDVLGSGFFQDPKTSRVQMFWDLEESPRPWETDTVMTRVGLGVLDT